MESQTPMKKYWIGKHAPEAADGWFAFYKAVREQGVLDRKTKELIAVAASVLLRCRHCVKSHVKDALKAGATREEIAEGIAVAAMIASSSQFFSVQEEMDELLVDD
jgi:AhpD family alkylhydroperoxidase